MPTKTKSGSDSASLSALFQTAMEEGDIGAVALGSIQQLDLGQQVGQAMGVRDEWILTPGSSESEIRKACQVFSQSAVRASQSAGSFSQQAVGGFATN